MATGHHHSAHASSEQYSIGHMYSVPWVQRLIQKIQDILRTNVDMLGLDPTKPQKLLDYACGHGTVSRALLNAYPHATFHGLDMDAAQVGRYNAAAVDLADSTRMQAMQGDLIKPQLALNDPLWEDFDAVITSMALHHIKDPVDLLKRMARRVRSGGSVVVVDFLRPGQDGSESSLVTLPQGEIWHGFSNGQALRYLAETGCSEVELREFPYDAGEGAPKEMEGLKSIFVAKGIVIC